MNEFVSDYLNSEYFFFLPEELKEQAEPLLARMTESLPENPGLADLEKSLKGALGLDLSPAVKKGLPSLLAAFFEYLEVQGRLPESERIQNDLNLLQQEHQKNIRADGSVKGATHKKNYTEVGRNDPCPCGSGKKFKKCCLNLIS